MLSIVESNLLCYEYLKFAAGLVYYEFRIRCVLKSHVDNREIFLMDGVFYELFFRTTSIFCL